MSHFAFLAPRHKGKFKNSMGGCGVYQYAQVYNFGRRGKFKKYMHNGYRKDRWTYKGKYVKTYM
jgi:hypothetical protein